MQALDYLNKLLPKVCQLLPERGWLLLPSPPPFRPLASDVIEQGAA